MRRVRLAIAVLLLLGSGASANADEPGIAIKSSGAIEGRFKTLNLTDDKVVLTLGSWTTDQSLRIVDPNAADRLSKARSGDRLQITVDDPGKPTELRELKGIWRPVDTAWVVLSLIGTFVSICGVAAAMLGRSPLRFLVGVDNRYSNSQTQLAIWFAAVASVYGAAVALRLSVLGGDFIGGVAIPQNLLVITGLSAFSFGGAKVITTQKVQAAQKPNQSAPKPAAAQANLLTDLVQNDQKQADLGDFQMILITFAASGIFLASAFHFLSALELVATVTLPDVDSTLLASFGIGQGAYLFKKAATTVGAG